MTSPLRRARQTADAVAGATGAPLLVDDGFIETDFGKWEGMTIAEASQRWPDQVSAWMAPAWTWHRRAARASPTSSSASTPRWTGCSPSTNSGRVLLVSHVSPIKIAARAMLAPPATLFRIQLDVASLCEIGWFPDGPAVVRSLNDTAHLSRAAGEPWPGV